MTFSVDELIEDIAARQMGLVTRAQLRAAGIAADVIDRRVRANRLRQVHRGVYRVGPLVAPRSRELAAVLACGPRAALSHRSAGALWELLPAADESAPIDISVSQGNRGRRPNIRVHRVSLPAHDVTSLEGIPVTSVCRTVLDLAALLGARDLERVLAQAERQHHLDQPTLQSIAANHAGRPGAPVLRALLQNEARPALTRSEAEERFLSLIRKAQLPAPETNVLAGEYEVDFLWRRERLVVEVDGFAFHSARQNFESDRRRDARLAARGLSVVRVTWRQLVQEPEAMVARLAQALARAGNSQPAIDSAAR
jgi:very-short-patch-repair endonuclease